ncbi:hypothetical protein [Streptomyces sp. NPDC048637]|uniref:hypothetical protein n=1 Tax=Streptomyces sp. NPDC048637 TaxID=3155636 RepID=UPI00344175DB
MLVDDLALDDYPIAGGWRRGVEVRVRAEVLLVDVPPVAPGYFSRDIIRVRPQRVITWKHERPSPTTSDDSGRPPVKQADSCSS